MTYAIRFHAKAWKEWNRIPPDLRLRLLAKLEERVIQPRVPSAALRGMKDGYKIKLRDAGLRLVYRVEDHILTVTVVAVGRRDGPVYDRAAGRLRD